MGTYYSISGKLKVAKTFAAMRCVIGLKHALGETDFAAKPEPDRILVDFSLSEEMGWGQVGEIDTALNALGDHLLEGVALEYETDEGRGVEFYGNAKQRAQAQSLHAKGLILEQLASLLTADAKELLRAVSKHVIAKSKHLPRRFGYCEICGHYGEDCTANQKTAAA